MASNTTTMPEAPSGFDKRLALRPREAARALGISPRLLWSLTNQGLVPHVRLGGKRIVYPCDLLAEMLRQRAEGVVG